MNVKIVNTYFLIYFPPKSMSNHKETTNIMILYFFLSMNSKDSTNMHEETNSAITNHENLLLDSTPHKLTTLLRKAISTVNLKSKTR